MALSLCLLFARTGQGQFLKVDASSGFIGIGTYYPLAPLNIQAYDYYSNGSSRVQVNHCHTKNWIVNYANANNFFVTGNGKIFSRYSTISTSDSTLKHNISTITNPLAKLDSLRGVTFRWKTDTAAARLDSTYVADTVTHFGFLAQEIKNVLPSVVDTFEGKYAVSYTDLIPLSVEGFKAQQNQIYYLAEGGSAICGEKSHFALGGCAAFSKTDILNTTSRYLEVKTDPSSDARREWIDSSDNKSLKYWDNQGTPVKQTVEIKSDKNAANGYAGLDGSSKLTGSQQKYGSTSNTACQGDDSRLSDSRAWKLSYYDNTTNTLPATTAETVFAAIQIPGGSLGSNDVIEITVSGDMSNTPNVKTYRLWWNNGPTIGGTLFSSKTVNFNASFSGYCKVVMKNSTTSQEVNGPNSNWDATGTANTGAVTASLNISADTYIILTGQKSNAGETMSMNNYQIKILKP